MPTTTCMRALRDVTHTPASAADRPPSAPEPALAELIRQPWSLRVLHRTYVVRPGTPRDLTAVARMHSRCSARSMLDRYRQGGRAPAVAALDHALRSPHSIVAATADGEVVAIGTLERDRAHSHHCAEVGLLVEDRWQRLGIGTELMCHLAGVAQVAGYRELIAYPATALATVSRLMVEVGRTRQVPDVELHLHTYLSESATLGLGSVRERLAG